MRRRCRPRVPGRRSGGASAAPRRSHRRGRPRRCPRCPWSRACPASCRSRGACLRSTRASAPWQWPLRRWSA
uniref:Uncharacterized protein n=1 Tax=Arundo donax TaxID=35708 RepID=A0A0A9B8M6_ARUDO